jgi:hypothetical protein
MQVNKRENTSVIIQKIDNIVMSNSETLIKDLDSNVEELSGLMDIMRDRVIQSTDVSHVIGLAKLGELKLQALKQKNDILKNLTAYKNAEAAGNKKGPGELSISDLLNSAALGAGMGAKLNMSGQSQPKLIDDSGQITDFVDVKVETRDLPSAAEVADTLMKDFK